jgi:hypothetical protein
MARAPFARRERRDSHSSDDFRPPFFAEVTARNWRLPGNMKAMPAQESGEPARVVENLAVDPGVLRMLPQLGGCRAGTEDLAEALILQRAHAHMQPGGFGIVAARRGRRRVRPSSAGLDGRVVYAGSFEPVQLLMQEGGQRASRAAQQQAGADRQRVAEGLPALLRASMTSPRRSGRGRRAGCLPRRLLSC